MRQKGYLSLRRIVILAMFVLSLQVSGAFAQSAQVYDQVDAAWMTATLNEMQLPFVQGTTPEGEPYFKVTYDGFNFMLYLKEQGTSLNAYTGFYEKVSAGIMNVWNYSKRYSRAYMDNDNHARLESDYSLKGGVTKDSVKVFIRTFGSSTKLFSEHVQKYTQPAQ